MRGAQVVYCVWRRYRWEGDVLDSAYFEADDAVARRDELNEGEMPEWDDPVFAGDFGDQTLLDYYVRPLFVNLSKAVA